MIAGIEVYWWSPLKSLTLCTPLPITLICFTISLEPEPVVVPAVWLVQLLARLVADVCRILCIHLYAQLGDSSEIDICGCSLVEACVGSVSDDVSPRANTITVGVIGGDNLA